MPARPSFVDVLFAVGSLAWVLTLWWAQTWYDGMLRKLLFLGWGFLLVQWILVIVTCTNDAPPWVYGNLPTTVNTHLISTVIVAAQVVGLFLDGGPWQRAPTLWWNRIWGVGILGIGLFRMVV